MSSPYRETFGLGWKRSSTRCAIPALLSSYSERARERPPAERGLTKLASQTVLNETGLFIPVGTGKSEYTVNNSAHFVSTINGERVLESEIMVSFEVESLQLKNVP